MKIIFEPKSTNRNFDQVVGFPMERLNYIVSVSCYIIVIDPLQFCLGFILESPCRSVCVGKGTIVLLSGWNIISYMHYRVSSLIPDKKVTSRKNEIFQEFRTQCAWQKNLALNLIRLSCLRYEKNISGKVDSFVPVEYSSIVKYYMSVTVLVFV